MNRGRKITLIVVAMALFGLAVFWLASGRLMNWLLALHGQH